METIAAFFKAVAAVFGFVNKRTDLKNSPEVQAAAKAQDNVNTRNQYENAVAKKDVADTRNNLAE
jgi:hypothetical protein